MRRFILCLLGAAALAVTAIAILPSLISSDWMRAELGRQLSSATGSSIAFNGPVKLSAFPSLAVVAEDVTLSAEAQGVTAEFAEVTGSVAFSSLWADRLRIKEISLDRPVIILDETAADETMPAQEGSEETRSSDPLPDLAALLERSAIDSVSITAGTFIRRSAARPEEVVSDVELTLSAPDIDDAFSLSASARMGDRNYEASFTISTLRSLLGGQPADLDLTVQADPAPAPGLSSLSASGQVTLNANGSYQIRGGKVETGEQVFGLNALFVPGKRAHFLADLDADRLDLTTFIDATPAPPQSKGPAADMATGAGQRAGLRFLAGFDADVSINAAAITFGEMSASDVSVSAELKDGKLAVALGQLGIDAGVLTADVATDVRSDDPVFRGRLSSEGLDIGSLSALADRSVPVSGALTIDAGFAFRGLDADTIRKTIDLTGTIGLRDASFALPLADETMREVKAKKISARIESLRKPVRLAGRLEWRNKPVDVDLRIPAADALLTGNFASEGIPLKLQLQMPDARLSLDGRAALPGNYAGRLDFSVADLSAFLSGFGQSGAESIGPLAFSGNVVSGATGVSFEKASVSVNGIEATGNGSVEFATPLKIETSLDFAELDLARLAGAGAPAPQPKAKAKAVESADVPLDLSSLRSVDATIRINAEKLGYGRVFAGPVTTMLVVSEGVASLTLPESPFYGGHVVASLKADGSQPVPSIALQASISRASSAPLLTDMAGFRYLEGALNARFDVTGAGGTTKTLAKSLQGTAEAAFADGAIRGIDIADVYNNLVRLISSGFKQDDSKATTFTELAASFAIEGGVARTEDIKLVGPLVRMTGKGAADLAQSALNFRLEPRIVASLQGQGAEISTDGVGVPVIVEGSFADPRIYPDLSELLKNPAAALAKLKALGLSIDKLPIGDLLDRSGEGSGGGSVKDLLGGVLDKALQSKEQQLSIEEIIGGDAASKADQTAAEVPPMEEPVTTGADSGAAVPAEEPDSPIESLFKQLLR